MADTKNHVVDGYGMRSMVTVNEARNDWGLGDLKDDDGKADPDGNLSVRDYERKEYESQREVAVADTPDPGIDSPRPFKNLR